MPTNGWPGSKMDSEFKPEHFTVAAKLFQELGERLVGSPAMALAELAKNAYDADAYHVEIQLRPEGRNEIVVRDSGHGMTREEFTRYWMRLGTRHKEVERESEYLGRPMSGSKGVGRIAAELLSHKLSLVTISHERQDEAVEATLDWDKALEKDELVQVTVQIRTRSPEPGEGVGTTIRLEGLKHDWPVEEVHELAKQIWRLQPPFRRQHGMGKPPMPSQIPPLPPARRAPEVRPKSTQVKKSSNVAFRRPEDFTIYFSATDKEALKEFNEILQILKRSYTAEIKGTIINGVPQISIEFEDQEPKVAKFTTLASSGPGIIKLAKFKIRVYELQGKQGKGVPVSEIREHLREYGGVQIYDNGFRLPYYGSAENDWLRITEDHARRLSKSELLPPEFQLPLGMHFMPTYYKVVGSVEISTANEPNLKISITRDRLADSPAFEALRSALRASIHWYGMLRTQFEEKGPGLKAVNTRVAMQSVRATLQELENRIKPEVYDALDKASRDAVKAARDREKAFTRQIALLSGLATAGVATIAYHNEVERQIGQIETLVAAHPRMPADVKTELLSWANRARDLRKVFSHLTHRENLEAETELLANGVLEDVEDQLSFVVSGVRIRREVPKGSLLARASYVEWTSILQLLLGSAAEAARNSGRPEVSVELVSSESRRGLVISSAIPPGEAETTPEGFDEFTENLTNPSKTGVAIVRSITAHRGWRFEETNDASAAIRKFTITWRAKDEKEEE